jgi:hypothetical membrane protein
MNNKSTNLSLLINWIQQASTYSGVVGPLVIAAGMLISALGYTGVEGQAYSLRNHFVSELGQAGVSRLAWIFNICLVVGGLFNALFLIGLSLRARGWFRYLTLILGVGSSICGMMVGFFPMNNLGPHIFWALSFFNLGMLVALLYSVAILLGKVGSLPRWLALPGLLNTAAFAIFNNFPDQFEDGVDFQEGMRGLLANRPDFIPLAALEWLVILGILVWFLILGLYLYLNENRIADHNEIIS